MLAGAAFVLAGYRAGWGAGGRILGSAMIRFYRGVLRQITPAVCRIAPNRSACDVSRSYSRAGRNRLLCVLIALCGYRDSLVHFWLVRFLQAIPTELRRDAEERSRRRSVSALLRNHIGFAAFSAGRTLGAEMWKPHCGRPQTCAKEPNVEAALRPLWTLFIGLAVMCVLRWEWAFGYNGDLTGSNLWPDGSGGIKMLSTRSIVQTRSALKR